MQKYMALILSLILTLTACQVAPVSHAPVIHHALQENTLSGFQKEPGADALLLEHGIQAIQLSSVSKQPQTLFKTQQVNADYREWLTYAWGVNGHGNIGLNTEKTEDYYGYVYHELYDNGAVVDPRYHKTYVYLPSAFQQGYYPAKPACQPEIAIYLQGVKLGTYKPLAYKLSFLASTLSESEKQDPYTFAVEYIHISWRAEPRYHFAQHPQNYTPGSAERPKKTGAQPFVIQTQASPTYCQNVQPADLQTGTNIHNTTHYLYTSVIPVKAADSQGGNNGGSRIFQREVCPSEWYDAALQMNREVLALYDEARTFASADFFSANLIYNRQFGVMNLAQQTLWHPFYEREVAFPTSQSAGHPFHIASSDPVPDPSASSSWEPSPDPSASSSWEPSPDPSASSSWEPSPDPSASSSWEPSPDPSASSSSEPSVQPSQAPRRQNKEGDDESYSPPMVSFDEATEETPRLGVAQRGSYIDAGSIARSLLPVFSLDTAENYPQTQVFDPLIAQHQNDLTLKQNELAQKTQQLSLTPAEEEAKRQQLQSDIDMLILANAKHQHAIERLAVLKTSLLQIREKALALESRMNAGGTRACFTTTEPYYEPRIDITYASRNLTGDLLIHGVINAENAALVDLNNIVLDFYGDMLLSGTPEVILDQLTLASGLFSTNRHFTLKVPADRYQFTQQYRDRIHAPFQPDADWEMDFQPMRVSLRLVFPQFEIAANQYERLTTSSLHERDCEGPGTLNNRLHQLKASACGLQFHFGKVLPQGINEAFKKGIRESTSEARLQEMMRYYLLRVFQQGQNEILVQQILSQQTAEKALMLALTLILPPDPREDPLGFCIYVVMTLTGTQAGKPLVAPIARLLSKVPAVDTMMARLFDDFVICISGHTIKTINPCSVSRVWSATQDLSGFENALKHYKKHVLERLEFPEIRTLQEYIDATHRFLKYPPPDTLGFVRNSDKAVVLFNPKTNNFGVLRADGIPQTFFRPKASGLSLSARNQALQKGWDGIDENYPMFYFRSLSR